MERPPWSGTGHSHLLREVEKLNATFGQLVLDLDHPGVCGVLPSLGIIVELFTISSEVEQRVEK